VPGQNKFPRRERLTRKSEYLDVYRNGEKQVGRAFICYTVRRQGQGRKLGISVSRKVGNAVVRNRLKRYVREIYRTHRTLLAEDAHIVLVARPAAVAFDYAACEEAIRKLLRKGGLLSG
jgi:ribonuclease P protein component